MTLTMAAGPFGHRPSGHFNFVPPDEVVYVEPFVRRVRALRKEERQVQKACLVGVENPETISLRFHVYRWIGCAIAKHCIPEELGHTGRHGQPRDIGRVVTWIP